jgi:MFS family permease
MTTLGHVASPTGSSIAARQAPDVNSDTPGTGPEDKGRSGEAPGREPRLGSRGFVLATVLALTVVAAARAVVQYQWGEVTGLDTGNWFTFGHAWLGDGLAGGAGSTYPPLVPVSVALLGRVLTPLGTMIVVGALATVVHGGCVAGVLWRAGCGWWSLPLAVLLAAGSAAGEAVAWGGTPQLLGLGLAFLVLYLVAELLTSPRAGAAWALGAAALLLGATSHLVLAEAAAGAVAMTLLRLLSPLPRVTWRSVLSLAAVYARAVAPCLLLVPLYLRLSATVGDSFAERRESQPLAEMLQAVDAVVRELPQLGRPATVFALLLPVVLWRERHRPLWLVTAALALLLAAVATVSPEPRFAYLVPLLVVAALGLLATSGRLVNRRVLRIAGTVLAALAIGISGARGLAAFPDQVHYYGALVPDGTTRALDALRETTRPGDVVAVPPVRGQPFGWWVEGYGKRAAFVGSSTRWLNFPRERTRAEAAVRLFSAGDVFTDRWFASARADGIDVVYIPATYDGITPELIQSLRREQPDLVLHGSPAATILEVP